MKSKKICISVFLVFVLSLTFSLNALAGTYNTTTSVDGTFSGSQVTVTNTVGASITGNAYRFTTMYNVTKLESSFRLNSTTDNTALSGMQIYYSSDGTNFSYGTTISCPISQQVSFTLNFGSSLKTVCALFFIPSSQYWPGYNYSVWDPYITQTLTDTTPPTITLTEQSGYSSTSNFITAIISDSQSGVSVRKWASGSQPVSYFASNGTSFSGSGFYVYSNGTYTVYTKDAAGNETIKTIYATKIDTSPPSITASVSSTYATTNTISVSVTDSQSGVNLLKWASGYDSVSYFDSNGTTFTGSTITVDENGYYTIYAKDNVGNVTVRQVYVSYVDNTVTVTHPISINYSINPNSATPFSCPDITVTNNSRIKVQVSVQQFRATTGGSISLTDVLPTKYSNWNTLTRSQTTTDIAMGLRIKEAGTGTSTWYSILNSGTLYAANISSKTALGILNPNGAVGNLSVTANYGLAWDKAYTSVHNLILVFDAY